MKKLKLLVLGLTILSIVSCSNETVIRQSETFLLEKKAESFLIKQLKDPNSYDGISIIITDSVKTSMYLQGKLEYNIITKLEKDSILNNGDPVKYIIIEFNYRAKNSFGALDICKTNICYLPNPQLTDEEFTILNN